MGLSFLVPAFFAGLLAMAIPIWVHLRNRQKTERVEFPSLMFLERIPYRTVQRQQLRHRALFALRCLALLLLVTAFARPLLGGVAATVVGGAGVREVVVLLDRSWSMTYGSTWQRATRAAESAAANLVAGDRISLVVFDSEAEVLVESSPDGAAVSAALASLGAGTGTTDLAAGLRAAREVLASSTQPLREIVLISDFQRVGWDVQGDVEMPEGTSVRPVAVGAETSENLSIADVSLERMQVEDSDRLAVSARLTRQGGEGPRTETATLEIDGAEVQSVQVEIPDSGATRVDFESVELFGDLARGVVRVGTDDLAADNEFHFVASPGQTLAVLLLENRRATATDSLFLERALGIGSRPAFRLERAALADLSAGLLRDAALVVLNDPGSIDAGAASLLVDHVEAGGGVLLILGELTDDLGALAGDGGLLPFNAAEAVDRADDLGATLGFVNTDHPAFEIFAAPASGDLGVSRFYRYRALDPSPVEGLLARFDDGAPALVEVTVGDGRVLVWTSSADLFWNDLARQPVYLPFIHQTARHAAGYREPRAWLDAGAPLGARQVMAAVGDGRGRRQAEDATLDGVPLVRTEGAVAPRAAPGFHDVAWRDERGPQQSVVAVNLDRGEADLSRVDSEEVAAAVVWRGGGAVQADDAGPVDPKIIEGRQSLWRYLLIVAFVLLAAETALSNRLSPRAS